MLKTYHQRLYLNKTQQKKIAQAFGCCRYIYNWGLETKVEAYKKDKTNLSVFDLNKKLTSLKQEKEFLKNCNVQSLQQSLNCLGFAFKNFFEGNASFPELKTKKSPQTINFPQFSKIKDSKIYLPKIGWTKFIKDREIEGKIKTVNVKQAKSGKYFVNILVENGGLFPAKREIVDKVGIDLGIKTYATISNGEKIDNPKFLKASEKRLKCLQKRHSRKMKGGKNKRKSAHKIAVQHEKITNQRKDFQHKVTTKLISENQWIAVEDLNVEGMVKNHKLAKAIEDCAWGQFSRMLKYKSDWYGSTYKEIGRFDPSSKTCSSCGYYKKDLTLDIREWVCPQCGKKLDRDLNASVNILNYSLRVAQGEPVELLKVPVSMTQSYLETSQSKNDETGILELAGAYISS